jgi:hypothetical protein
MGTPPGGGTGLAGASGIPGQPPVSPQQQALFAALSGRGSGAPSPALMGYKKGGKVNTFNSTKAAPGNLATRPGKGKMAEGGEVDEFNSTKGAPGNLATRPGKEKLAKGGVLRRKPKAVKAAKAKSAPQPPPDDTEPLPTAAGAPNLGPALGASMPPPVAPGPPGMAKGGKCDDKDKDGMAKGGECDKMAAGGAAKQRRKFPNTTPPPKKFASGGGVRGCGAAERGTKFSGIY